MLYCSEYWSLSDFTDHITVARRRMQSNRISPTIEKKKASSNNIAGSKTGCYINSFDDEAFIAARMSSDDTNVGSYQKPDDGASPRSS
jgi:hypothetical protein